MSLAAIALLALASVALLHLVVVTALVTSAVLPNAATQLASHRDPARFGLAPERVALPSGAAAWWLPHPTEETVVLVCHGRSRSKAWMLPLLGALSPHVSVLAFDFPGHGDNPKPRWTTIGAREAQTVADALAWLEARGRRCIVYGVSMGGAAAILALAAERRPFVIGLVTDGTYDRLDRVFDNVLSVTPFIPGYVRATAERTMQAITGWHPRAIRPVDQIGRIEVPILLLHGDRDPLIPPIASMMLAQQSPTATLQPYAGRHDEPTNAEMQAHVVAFVRARLADAADAA